jgi:hypothetical protein
MSKRTWRVYRVIAIDLLCEAHAILEDIYPLDPSAQLGRGCVEPHDIAELVPLEDRHADRLVFPRVTDMQIRDHLRRACRNAGIAHYHPHDLRHRRISLWIAQGFDPVTVKTWAGHARASMSLDVYAHVVIDPNADEWQAFWREAYAAERSRGVVPVWSRDGEIDGDPPAQPKLKLQES